MPGDIWPRSCTVPDGVRSPRNARSGRHVSHAGNPEDVLIAKLEWAKIGDSERQLVDAAGIVKMQRETLDIAYIEKWVELLDLQRQWHAAREIPL